MVTTQNAPGLSPARRRRLLIGAATRSLAAAAVVTVLYYVLPLDRSWDADTGFRLLIGIVAFAGLMAWQVRAITLARYPGVRAAQSLGLLLPLFLVVFASTYFLMEQAAAGSFTEPLTRTDALYFTVTTFATVGFGDIAPKSETARIILMVQMLIDLAILGAGARLLLQAVNRGRERRTAPADAGDRD